jgi:uncharacterized protein
VPLHYEAPRGHLYVRWVRADSIAVADRTFTRSFLLTREQACDWQVAALSDFQGEALAPLFELEPELVILGTGPRQVFPSQQTLAAFLTRGIGIEVMDNAAAARTFNVLAAEGRRVLAAFVIG